MQSTTTVEAVMIISVVFILFLPRIIRAWKERA